MLVPFTVVTLLPWCLGVPVVLETPFLRVEVDTDTNGGISLSGDFEGKGSYGVPAMTGIVTQVTNDLGVVTPLKVCQVQHLNHSVFLETATDCTVKDIAENVTLNVDTHFLTIQTSGRGKGAIHRVFQFAGASIFNVFGLGVVQMMQAKKDHPMYRYPTYDTIAKTYALGAVSNGEGVRGDVCGAVLEAKVKSDATPQHLAVVKANYRDVALYQYLTECNLTTDENTWSTAQWARPCKPSGSTENWTSTFRLSANNHDFPVISAEQGIVAKGDAGEALRDYIAMMTGIYASPVGNLCTHPNEVSPGTTVAQIATSLASPTRGYAGGYNFFDPDNYLALSAIMYSADPDLLPEVKKVIMRSGDFIKPTGQLPHHFIDTTPTYLAISGATQTGPNVFWIKTALTYVKVTQDMEFLKRYMPTIEKAALYLVGQVVQNHSVPGKGTIEALLNAQGSLMIDVFIRANFTTDSNAALVLLFNDLAEAYTAIGDTASADKYTQLASRIGRSVWANLWDTQSQDHYITDLSPSGLTRDFVDYDANLLALAAGLADNGDRALSILRRIDSGRCGKSHTFVSEKWYGPDATFKHNVGDSWTAMGRIAWFDALSRKRVAQQLYRNNVTVASAALQHFDNVLLDPIRDAVLNNTWVRERFGCGGEQQLNRTKYYFEYPSVAAMMVHRVRYGIELGLNTHRIAPFGRTSFNYSVGFVRVKHSPSYFEFLGRGEGVRDFIIEGLRGGMVYTHTSTLCDHTTTQSLTADAAGQVTFKAFVGDSRGQPCLQTLTLTARS
eukprot:Sspe_Gene.14992::Locus_5196_Transcript_2_2_Confidence_0.667_Length_4954::g.14992::m.14992